jgi:hypothetical protein
MLEMEGRRAVVWGQEGRGWADPVRGLKVVGLVW